MPHHSPERIKPTSAHVYPGNMPDRPVPPNERLKETTDTLLATAERCYRLARSITDRQAVEALLRVAEECEERADELRNQT